MARGVEGLSGIEDLFPIKNGPHKFFKEAGEKWCEKIGLTYTVMISVSL